MYKKSLSYDCCHEAGHAVIARLHGYKIRRIKLREPSEFPWDDNENGACTEYDIEPWACALCRFEIEDRNDAALQANLKDECGGCREEKQRFIQRCSGGDAATFLLQRTEYDCTDSGFDWIQIRSVYPNDPSMQDRAIEGGRQAAALIIEQNSRAVAALCDALKLLGVGAEMNGENVERIVDPLLEKAVSLP